MVVGDKPTSESKRADGAGLPLTSTPPSNPSQPSENDMPDNQDAGAFSARQVVVSLRQREDVDWRLQARRSTISPPRLRMITLLWQR